MSREDFIGQAPFYGLRIEVLFVAGNKGSVGAIYEQCYVSAPTHLIVSAVPLIVSYRLSVIQRAAAKSSAV